MESEDAQIRPATPEDFGALAELEALCFEPERRAKPRALRHALRSPAQRVALLRGDGGEVVGAVTCLLYPRTLRVYSIAVHPLARGKGAGLRLLGWAEAFARESGRRRVSLEAAERDAPLVAWYRKRNYEPLGRLEDYYAPGVHALRLAKVLDPLPGRLELPRSREYGKVDSP